MEGQDQQMPSWVNALLQQHAAQAEDQEWQLMAVLEQLTSELNQRLHEQEQQFAATIKQQN